MTKSLLIVCFPPQYVVHGDVNNRLRCRIMAVLQADFSRMGRPTGVYLPHSPGSFRPAIGLHLYEVQYLHHLRTIL